MYAIVSFLEKEFEEKIFGIWEKLQSELDISFGYQNPIPHFSYHVAEEYKIPAIEHSLGRVIEKNGIMQIRTNGIGIFTNPNKVIYLQIVRSPQLSMLHQNIWEEVSAISTGSLNYYHPINWIPHITLANKGLDFSKLSALLAILQEYDLNWTIKIKNISIICEECTPLNSDNKYHLATCLNMITKMRFLR